MTNGTRVATGNENVGYKLGTIIDQKENLSLVKFDYGTSRWCTTRNLSLVTKN